MMCKPGEMLGHPKQHSQQLPYSKTGKSSCSNCIITTRGNASVRYKHGLKFQKSAFSCYYTTYYKSQCPCICTLVHPLLSVIRPASISAPVLCIINTCSSCKHYSGGLQVCVGHAATHCFSISKHI